MTTFSEEEKNRLFDLLEEIVRANHEIVSHLAIANINTIEEAFDRAFADDLERRIYEMANGELSIREMSEILAVGKMMVQSRVERLAGLMLIEKTPKNRYRKSSSKTDIVRRFSKQEQEI